MLRSPSYNNLYYFLTPNSGNCHMLTVNAILQHPGDQLLPPGELGKGYDGA